MNVLHLLTSGETGGIEVLMQNYVQHSIHQNSFVFVWKSGEIAQKMERDGITVHTLDAHRQGAVATLERIRQICLLEKPDVVVSHHSAPLLKLALLYIKLFYPKIRTVAYAHANAKDICDYGRKKGLLVRKTIHRLGFAAADGVIAISKSVKDSLHTCLGVSPQKVRLIYNGTAVDAQIPERPERGENACLKLIYVGRLIPEKGVQTTLHMLAKLHGEIPFVFNIVGDGPCRKELEALVQKWKLTDCVRFLGRREDVQSALRQADVFVHLPAWEEGFGITVIEAMAQGLVCLVNDRGAMPEIVEDNISGFVVDAQNPDSAGNILRRLSEAPASDWKQLQKNACLRAQAFSLEQFAEELDRYFIENI